MTFNDDELLGMIASAWEASVPPVPERLSQLARNKGLAALRGSTVGAHPAGIVRLNRELPAAAAAGSRVLTGNYASSDSRFTTSIAENEEGRLIVNVESDEPFEGFVRFVWTAVGNESVDASKTIVTPLVESRRGWSAEYDLGSIRSAAAVDVEPAEAVAEDLVTRSEVEMAFEVVQHGSARRAWQSAIDERRLPSWITELARKLMS